VTSPRLICEIEFPELNGAPTILYRSLIENLRKLITEGFKSILYASQLKLIVSKENPTSFFLRDLAEQRFVEAFEKWNPQRLAAFREAEEVVIDALQLQILATPDQEEKDTKESRTLTFDCRAHVCQLLKTWHEQYESDDLAKCDLEEILELVETKSWRKLADYSRENFPAKDEIKLKLAELNSLENSILQKLTIVDDKQKITLPILLKEYKCKPCNDEIIHKILKLIGYLFEPISVLQPKRSLRDIRFADALVGDFLAESRCALQLCAHFKFYPSVIFRKSIFFAKEMHESFRSLKSCVDEAIVIIEKSFGPSSDYQGVLRAWQMLLDVQSLESTDVEFESLTGCSEFTLCASDIETFRTISLLSDLSSPITQFFEASEHFGFSICSHDTTFLQLKRLCSSFYDGSENARSREQCIKFAHKLNSIFSGCELIGSQGGNDTLREVLPILKLFSIIRSYPGVWICAEQMGWFGEVGLKRFYSEHSNVTNVLLGNSVSYEMSILDSMEPSIRLVSTLAGYTHLEQMQTLLAELRSNDDVINASRGNIMTDFRQVHTRLSEIKEWFSTGVDEIAATHVLFKSICNSGSYLISTSKECVKHIKGLHSSDQYSLALEYSLEGTLEKERIYGNDLHQFFQHLSEIKDENPGVTSGMKEIIDQYQIILSTVKNILKMNNVGYDKMLISEFTCRVGTMYMDSATQILQESNIHMETFQSWLALTRENYQLSSIFWLEELRELHTLLQLTMSDWSFLDRLCVHMFKVFTIRDKMLTRAIAIDSLRECVKSWKSNYSEAKSWFTEISTFLDKLKWFHGDDSVITNEKPSTIVLHFNSSAEHYSSSFVLRILCQIYFVSL
jgi:hypothetical protein